MARYGAGVTRTGINTADQAYFNLDNTGTADRLKIVQIIVSISVAPTNAPSWYLTRATTRGTQTSTLAGIPFDPAEAAAIGTLDVCGGTQPAFTAANKLSVGALAITAGGVWVWSFFDSPLIITNVAGNGIIVANAVAAGAATGTYFCSYLWEE